MPGRLEPGNWLVRDAGRLVVADRHRTYRCMRKEAWQACRPDRAAGLGWSVVTLLQREDGGGIDRMGA